MWDVSIPAIPDVGPVGFVLYSTMAVITMSFIFMCLNRSTDRVYAVYKKLAK